MDSAAALLERVATGVSQVYVGAERNVRLIVAAVAAGLHVLIEDVPGVGKTTLARSVARAFGLEFGRIQFTPDLMPGDVVGVSIWSPQEQRFVFKPGAIMRQCLLADELNRSPARTQAALLEGMQEASVTVDGRTYPLPSPFIVIATQNPQEFAGTFQLPESQLDRFGVSLSLGYPSREHAGQILDRFRTTEVGSAVQELQPVLDPERTVALQKEVRAVHVSDPVREYVLSICEQTRRSEAVGLGASPRAAQHLVRMGQAMALSGGRDFLIPEDVRDAAGIVLRHRLVVTDQARVEGRTALDVIDAILGRIPVPTGIE